MRRYVTHDSTTTSYWLTKGAAVRHIQLWHKRTGVVLDLYREREPKWFGPGVYVASGSDLI